MTTQWRKSSYSTAIQDEACVELAPLPPTVAIRDSKNPHLGHLTLPSHRFAGLINHIKRHDPSA